MNKKKYIPYNIVVEDWNSSFHEYVNSAEKIVH